MEMELGDSETEFTVARTPDPTANRLKRRRPYRGSMQDSSMDESVQELELVKKEGCVSPSTNRIIGGVAAVFRELRELNEDQSALFA